jgi:hypothetical protein
VLVGCPLTAGYFVELVVPPIPMPALFGEDLRALRAKTWSHVARIVPFFFAVCRHGGVD